MDLSQYKVESKNILTDNNNDSSNNDTISIKYVERKKPGRKPAVEPLKKLISVYFTDEEYKLIETIADGRPLAGVLRKIIKKYLSNKM